ncbi:hypothetical protein U0070_001065 [Myodes glareolus]|uniref:2-acylglycerol O-acyltransferase 1 n=1 Tax=Myodes glareolus TaxID=447135 RepID=A0AAW0IWV0_MYOGA
MELFGSKEGVGKGRKAVDRMNKWSNPGGDPDPSEWVGGRLTSPRIPRVLRRAAQGTRGTEEPQHPASAPPQEKFRPRPLELPPGRVEFAPLNTPLARRLQRVAVLQWVVTFILIAQTLKAWLATVHSVPLWTPKGHCIQQPVLPLSPQAPSTISHATLTVTRDEQEEQRNPGSKLSLQAKEGKNLFNGEVTGGRSHLACPSLAAPVCTGVMVLLIVYNYWYIYIPYLIWLYFDWQTPEQGGRRSNWVKNWTVWRHFKDYFPLHLNKTQDLDPRQNYIFGFHPHGIFATGAFGNFCINYSDFKKQFPDFTPYLHSLVCFFKVPFGREYVMSMGVVPVSKKSISHVLSKDGGGNISIIVLGGARESLEAHPGNMHTQPLSRHTGVFLKIQLCTHSHTQANQHFPSVPKTCVLPSCPARASLVPVFSFGENELFKQINNPEGSWLRMVQEKLKKSTGITLPLCYARGIFQNNFGLVPYRKPIYTIVGRPIPVRRTPHPTQEQTDQLHQTYLEELKKLFDEHKGKYGIPEHKTLVFK